MPKNRNAPCVRAVCACTGRRLWCCCSRAWASRRRGRTARRRRSGSREREDGREGRADQKPDARLEIDLSTPEKALQAHIQAFSNRDRRDFRHGDQGLPGVLFV